MPKHINEQIILDAINPAKDADGFHPLNVGKLSIANHNDENLLINISMGKDFFSSSETVF